MKYRGTRGVYSELSFEETLFHGWLSSGGLLMPDYVPKLSKAKLQSWSSYSYTEICMEVFMLFAGEEFLSKDQLQSVLATAFAPFPKEVIPLKRIDDNGYIVELFHGPTHSFKDLPISVAGPLLDAALKRCKKHGIVYVCTSGDTGSAVINATKNSHNVDTITFLPGGERITQLQRLLMTTVNSRNIHNFTGECFCDEFDGFFSTFPSTLQEKYPELIVTSLNSLTWVRVMMQTCHILYAYFQIAKDFQPISFVIPTGGAGHVTSALVAKKLGLPINIISSFNEKNLNLYNFLSGKELKYDMAARQSLSPAMDRQSPRNLERLIYLLTDGDVDVVKRHMEAYYVNGSAKASEDLLKKIEENLKTFVATDEDIIETMKRCWNTYEYVIDPHTATGFTHFFKKDSSSSEIVLYMATASPIKFNQVLQFAGIPIPLAYTNYLSELKSRQENYVKLPTDREDWKSFLLQYIEENIMQG